MLLVSDASVLIDIEMAGLSEEMFRLAHEFAVPDLLFEEELRDRHEALLTLGLQLRQMPAIVIETSVRLRHRYRHPSQNDLFALALAMHEQCDLLSGDRRLVEAARELGLNTRGTLWILEELLTTGSIAVAQARASYAAMRHGGSRLPWGEIELQLARWSGG